ncbi:response regulator [Dongia deserti]|uniref:response regulator n=1 Tax=Dongia deserti TaxID=2268030 RepID=UPI000E64C45C|nr:response regulator [Dongia deserti]
MIGREASNGHVEILIAEDSATQAMQLQSTLEGRGYSVVVAGDGEQALTLARRSKPALIVSDVVMPKLDGYGLCAAIKSDDGLKEIPVILVTTLTDPQDVIRGLESGADNFLRKPVDQQYLLSRIDYILMNRELRKSQKMRLGVEINIGGRRQFITAERQQILDLLISTYEQAVQINQDLKQREQELARSNHLLAELYRIAESLNRAVSEVEVADAALERILELPNVRSGWIRLIDAAGEFRTVACRDLPAWLSAADAFAGPCSCQRKLADGVLSGAVNIGDCERMKATAIGELESRYHACVPLIISGRTIGVMNAIGYGDGSLDQDALKVLDGIGNQVAAALDRAQLHQNLERRVEERTLELTEAIQQLGREVQVRRQAQDNLQQAQDSLRTVIDSSPLAIFAEDREGKVDLWNASAERIFGIPSDGVLGRSLLDILERDPRVLAVAIDEVQAGKQRQNIELPYRRPDGKNIELRLSMAPLHGRPGEIPRVLYIADDVTEQRATERQLVQAQKMEAVGQLTGGIAHDFNNLLTVIIGNLELLDGPLTADPKASEVAAAALHASLRGAELTRQLLAFSHKQALQPKEVDLNTIVSSTTKLLKRTLGETITVRLRLHEELKTAVADPAQLESALANLAINARDAMPSGGVLTVETDNTYLDAAYAAANPGVTPGEYAMVAVSDTGTGIPADILHRVFEPFFTTKEAGKGTGLGLSMVYGFVRHSGGHVKIYSEVGHGTTVRIYLPCASGESASAAEPDIDEVLSETPKVRVLVVEDNSEVRNVVVRQLTEMGHRVQQAENGTKALAILREDRAIDLLFTDVVMPGGMTGLDLARQAKKLCPGLKVLLTSGFSNMGARNEGDAHDDLELLSKPYQRQQLARKLRDTLRSR